jgi:hypothetical protein
VAVVNAHGQENAEAMLPLFESYLDKQVGAAVPAVPAMRDMCLRCC